MPDQHPQPLVYVVHTVDTEGPLHEPLEATFTRLKELFNIDLEPTRANLKKIQNKEIDLNGLEATVAEVFAPKYLNYNDTWEKIDTMLSRVMSPAYRQQFKDSLGNGWVYNWHCVDHVGYESNPRRKSIGYHVIFDHYVDMIKKTNSARDGLHWHYHPMSVYKEAHRCATSYVGSTHLYEILCRRVIDRGWFPRANRAGFQVERPDSHWFLEQWIPFDISNMALENADELEAHADLAHGRFGDWRLAPKDWSIYQPSHDNYQLPGHCRRWIARSLNMGMRMGNIDQHEVNKAFERAAAGQSTILGVSNHDFRDIAPDVESLHAMLMAASKKFPQVSFKLSEVVEAFNDVIYGPKREEPLKLGVDLRFENGRGELIVQTLKGKVFGPQPFLAVKFKDGQYRHENFDLDPSLTAWSYTFDEDSIRPVDIEAIGVAANDAHANTFVKVIQALEDQDRVV